MIAHPSHQKNLANLTTNCWQRLETNQEVPEFTADGAYTDTISENKS